MIKDYNTPSVPQEISKNFSEAIIEGLYYATEAPMFDFGKNYYMTVPDSEYNVVRIDAVYMYLAYEGPRFTILYHTPDGKQRTKKLERFRCDQAIFPTIEQYMSYCMDSSKSFDNGVQHILVTDLFKDIYGSMDFHQNCEGKIFLLQHCWEDKKVEPEVLQISRLWIDKNGAHMTFRNGGCGYKTKEECFKENFKLGLGDFAEDKVATKKFKVSVTIEVEATTAAEAKKVAKEKVAYIME